MTTTSTEKKIPLSGFGSPLRIVALALAAIAGLWFSSRYIEPKNKKPAFHEVIWNPKAVIQTLIDNGRKNTKTLVNDLKQKQAEAIESKKQWLTSTAMNAKAKAAIIRSTDTLKARAGFFADSIEQAQLKALDRIEQWLATRSDTMLRSELSKTPLLYLHVNDLSIDDPSFDSNGRSTFAPFFNASLLDPALAKGQITGRVSLQVKEYPYSFQFFNKYPGFALWSLLLIVQATLFSVLIIGFLFHFLSDSANSLYKQHLGYHRYKILPLLGGMSLFLLGIFFMLIHNDKGPLASGKFFMLRMHDFFFFVNMLGHIAAAFCLAGMINCVIYMNQLKARSTTADNTALSSGIIEQLRQEIKRRFNAYFAFIAIILSMAIFTTGTFYSSLNGLEFVKQVTKDQGFSPVNTDMVYIYGILNSFFLLLVYLPLRYILASLDKAIPLPPAPVPAVAAAAGNGAEQVPETEKKEGSFLNKFLKQLTGMKEVLITASPFLASLLQELLDALFT